MRNRGRLKALGIAFGALLLAGIVVSLGCGKGDPGRTSGGGHGPAGKNELRTVRIGYLPIVSNLPLFAALEKGWFRDEGIKVELTKFETSNQMVEAMIAGRIDGTADCAATPMLSVCQNQRGAIRLYMWTVLTSDIPFMKIIVPKGSGIKSMEELKGKKIACFPGSQIMLYMKLILRKFMDPDKDIVIQQMAPPNMVPALASGAVDAIYTLEPIGTIALEEGVGEVLIASPLTKYFSEDFAMAGWAFSAKFADEDRDLAREFQGVVYRGLEHVRAHSDEVKALYPKFTPLKGEICKKVPFPHNWTIGELNMEKFQEVIKVLHEGGVLDKAVDPETVIFR